MSTYLHFASHLTIRARDYWQRTIVYDMIWNLWKRKTENWGISPYMDCKFHSLSSKRSRSILSSKYKFRHQWYGLKKLGRSSLLACIFNSLSNNFNKGWLTGKIYIRQISQAELQSWFLTKRNSFQVLKRQNKICLEYLFNDQSFSFFQGLPDVTTF